jgi:hypothetical protein
MNLNPLGETVMTASASGGFFVGSFGNQNVPTIDVKSWVLDEKDEKIEQLTAELEVLKSKVLKIESRLEQDDG